MSLEAVERQVRAVNQSLAVKLSDTRGFLGIVDAQPCKGCGYEYAVAEYEYHIVYSVFAEYENVMGEYIKERLVREVVCHDCAWPKNGDYLREKGSKEATH